MRSSVDHAVNLVARKKFQLNEKLKPNLGSLDM